MYKLSKPNICEDEINAVADVLRSGNLVYGAKGREFESALERFTGSGSSRVVSSGTAALYIALKSLGIGEGDAVIVPGFTFPATVNAVIVCGAVPIICDVDPLTYCIDPVLIRQAIDSWQGQEKIKAVLPVHEFGYPADMLKILDIASEHNLFVVEDAACAIGSTLNGQHLGTFGDIGCFSFHPRKMLTTGEGGAVVSGNTDLVAKIEEFRNHGMTFQSGIASFERPALNFRLSDIQSAMGVVQLGKISQAIKSRSKLASRYNDLLGDEALLSLPSSIDGQNWQTFMVVLDDSLDRPTIISHLRESGIETNLGAQSIVRMPSFEPYVLGNTETPISDRLYFQGLALPLTEQYGVQDIDLIATKLLTVLNSA